MLVLRRQVGESFRVGSDVEVRVLSVTRGQVKIGVIAPRRIEVYRTELAEMNRKAIVEDWSSESNRASLESVAERLKSSAGR